MSTAERLPIRSTSSNSSHTQTLKETLSKRLSKELVISMCGPLGCGIKQIARALKDQLQEAGYTVVTIRISDLIHKESSDTSKFPTLKEHLLKPEDKYHERIRKLQQLGNGLRKAFTNSVGAQLAIRDITVWRETHPKAKTTRPDSIAIEEHTVFIIDQLKHPEEAELLKTAYGSLYYQLGIVSKESEKIQRLIDNRVSRPEASHLIEIDRKENQKHGQQLEKTLQLSDYYISNNSGNLPSLRKNIERFLSLIHGVNGITPTKDEVGMYTAYSASLRSACLSRQVGAAICDSEGNVLSIGRNDVPKFGGGLYTAEDGDNDHRCINHGAKCYNTERIEFLKDDISEILRDIGVDGEGVENAIERIGNETTLGALIEFSRAIHAEMDAILTLARGSGIGSKNTTIYTTTFPCHNCARHIVTAGITRIVYIEPYEKSLAITLHSDSLILGENDASKVSVLSFEGVSPRRYQVLFAKGKIKDSKGLAVTNSITDLNHIDPVLLARYTETEDQIAKSITEKIEAYSG